jgi:hypothetical protein
LPVSLARSRQLMRETEQVRLIVEEGAIGAAVSLALLAGAIVLGRASDGEKALGTGIRSRRERGRTAADNRTDGIVCSS